MSVIWNAALSVFVRAIGASILFLLTVLVSRELGVEGAGHYFLAYALIMVLSVISKAGFDNVVLRLTSVAYGDGDVAKIKRILLNAIFFTLLVSLFVSVVFYFSAGFIVRSFFFEDRLIGIFQIAVFCTPLFVISSLFAMVLQGMRLTLASVVVLNILTSLFVVVALIIFELKSANEVFSYLFLSLFVSCVTGFLLLRKVFFQKGVKAVTLREMIGGSLPLWVVSIMGLLTQWSGQLMVGFFGDLSEVALLAVAQRTSMLVALVLMSINMVVSPTFASLYAKQDIKGLERIACLSVRFMIVFAMPMLLIMIFYPRELLLLFGEEFEPASECLRVLGIGQFVNVLTGSVGYLLSMSGHEKDLRNAASISGVVCVLVGYLLIPLYGMLGAAYAIMGAVVLQNVMCVFLVKKRLGINTLLFMKSFDA